jgi:3-hydroxyisobutyrate dehydrogenase-like beta-hydroxyacid dehydrogenase
MAKLASVGLIGVGTMGRGLARNITRAGYELGVFDRQQSAVDEAVSFGARACAAPSEMLERADFVLTCLPTVESIRDVYLGSGGLIAAAPKKVPFVDCSTSDPDLTREIGRRAATIGCALIDAPMLRNAQAAWEGRLHFLVGGAADDIARARPVLEKLCERIVETGLLGSAHVVKLLNNAVTIVNSTIIAESFSLARNLRWTFERSTTFSTRAKRVANRYIALRLA